MASRLLFLTLATACDAQLVLQGAGASSSKQLYQGATSAYLVEGGNPVLVEFAPMGSGQGTCRIKGWATECAEGDDAKPQLMDFAASDSILSAADYLAYPDLQMYPTAASAVVPIYNLPGVTPEDPPLLLSLAALSDIFRSNLTRWDDDRIQGVNPVLAAAGKLPAQDIVVVVEDDASGMAEVFKRALASVDPAGFGAQIGTSSAADWPGATVLPCAGVPLGLASCVLSTPFSIGYAALAEVLADALPNAQLLMPGAAAPVRATVESVSAALSEFATAFGNNGDDPARLTLDLHGTRGLSSWPISGATYLVLRKETSLFPGVEEECERREEVPPTRFIPRWPFFYCMGGPPLLIRTGSPLLYHPLPPPDVSPAAPP